MKHYLTITLTNYNDWADDDLPSLARFYNRLLSKHGVQLIIDQSYSNSIDFTSTEADWETINKAHQLLTSYDKQNSIIYIREVR